MNTGEIQSPARVNKIVEKTHLLVDHVILICIFFLHCSNLGEEVDCYVRDFSIVRVPALQPRKVSSTVFLRNGYRISEITESGYGLHIKTLHVTSHMCATLFYSLRSLGIHES